MLYSNIDSTYQGFTVKRSDNIDDYESNCSLNVFRILYGIVEMPSMKSPVSILSFDVLWIRLQFMTTIDNIQIRRGYGLSGFTEWKIIFP